MFTIFMLSYSYFDDTNGNGILPVGHVTYSDNEGSTPSPGFTQKSTNVLPSGIQISKFSSINVNQHKSLILLIFLWRRSWWLVEFKIFEKNTLISSFFCVCVLKNTLP